MAVSVVVATVARRVDDERKTVGMAVLPLSVATGIPRTTLTRFLAGKGDLEVSRIFVLARALKIDASSWMADLPKDNS